MIEDSVKQLLEVEQRMEEKRREAEKTTKAMKEENRTQRRLEVEKSKEEIVRFRETLLRDQQEQLKKIRIENENELRETHNGYEQKYLANKEEAVAYILEKVRTDSGS